MRLYLAIFNMEIMIIDKPVVNVRKNLIHLTVEVLLLIMDNLDERDMITFASTCYTL